MDDALSRWPDIGAGGSVARPAARRQHLVDIAALEHGDAKRVAMVDRAFVVAVRQDHPADAGRLDGAGQGVRVAHLKRFIPKELEKVETQLLAVEQAEAAGRSPETVFEDLKTFSVADLLLMMVNAADKTAREIMYEALKIKLGQG